MGKSHFYAFQNDHPVERHLCSGSPQVPNRQLTLVKCLIPSQQAPIYTGFYRAEIRGGGLGRGTNIPVLGRSRYRPFVKQQKIRQDKKHFVKNEKMCSKLHEIMRTSVKQAAIKNVQEGSRKIIKMWQDGYYQRNKALLFCFINPVQTSKYSI